MKKIWGQFYQGVWLPHFHLNECELSAKLLLKKLADSDV